MGKPMGFHATPNDDGEMEETEILLIVQLIGKQRAPVMLYNGLGQPYPLDWDELISYLS